MADKKISQLSFASTPLAGTEVLPIVQSSTTVKVATNDLTVKNIRSNATTGMLQIAGPATASTRTMTVPDANFTAARTDAAQSFTGDQTLATGNLIQGTAAKGIDFTANTPAAGKTSTLLNWYEQGSWTPTVTSATGVITFVETLESYYTRVGRLVHVYVSFGMTTDASVGTSNITIGGLPFASVGRGFGNFVYTNFGSVDYGTGGAHGLVFVSASAISHVVRSVNISSRSSTFYWGYSATYTTS